MIYVRISDGLGNQLFQYAVAKSVQLKFKTEVSLDHLSMYKDLYCMKALFCRRAENLPHIENLGKEYFLDKFNITLPPSDIQSICEFYLGESRLRRLIFINRLYARQNALRKLTLKGKYYSDESHLLVRHNPDFTVELYADIMQQIEQAGPSKNVYLVGGWQVKDFAGTASAALKKELTLKEVNKSPEFFRVQALIRESESVSIHFRQKLNSEKAFKPHRNVQLKLSLDCSYYLEAIEVLRKQINRPFKLFVFSDDMEWVKKNFPLQKWDCFLVSEQKGLEEYEELILMSLCKHNIIANSTFSWWCAWLNSHPNKLLIAPSKSRWTLAPEGGADVLFEKNCIRL